jgi:hypothetical protein
LDEADARYGGHISTHYEGCYLDHVGCFAVAVRDVFDQAHTPTADERAVQALIYAAHAEIDRREEYAEQYGHPAFQDEPSAFLDGVRWAAGFRRPKVPMPDWASDRSADFDIATSRPLGPEPQGEPTDAEKTAAARAIFEGYVGSGYGFDSLTYFYDREKAEHVADRALTAAYETKGENRG